MVVLVEGGGVAELGGDSCWSEGAWDLTLCLWLALRV